MECMRALLPLAVCLLLAACSSEPERPVERVDGTVVFRLTAQPEGVEVRLEAGFHPTSGYELMTHAEGTTIVLEGVRAPLEATGARSPASAIVKLDAEKTAEGSTWSLALKLPLGTGAARIDNYRVLHTAAGWKVSPGQGSFSRFEPQGSY